MYKINAHSISSIMGCNGQLYMYGYVNKQYCRIWDITNLHDMQGRPKHFKKVTILWEFLTSTFIVSHFFQSNVGLTRSVTCCQLWTFLGWTRWPAPQHYDILTGWRYESSNYSTHWIYCRNEVFFPFELFIRLLLGFDTYYNNSFSNL